MPKKHLEEQNESDVHSGNTEAREGGIKDTMIKFPQAHSSRTEARKIEELVSDLTGKPIHNTFAGSIEIPLKPITGEKPPMALYEIRKHRVEDTRKRVSGLISGHSVSRSTGGHSKKPSGRPSQSGQNRRPPYPLDKIFRDKK